MAEMVKTIRSVGIDIGTTTTQLIFSSLQIMNRAPATQVPRYEFIERKILYTSEIYLTPILPDATIDEQALREIIRAEYARAGFKPGDIETGAVIITGETAGARNARTVLLRLTEELGNFIVATAGPHLEAVIAGKGAGGDRYSEDYLTRVINIDIGGGTSNFAVFHSGRVEQTACIQVGGRLIEVEPNGTVTKIHPPVRSIMRQLLPHFQERFTMLTFADIRMIVEKMADLIVECLQANPSNLAKSLLLTAPLSPVEGKPCLTFSGGVGECYYYPELWQHAPFRFGDIGPLLARALSQHPYFSRQRILCPRQTIRATVIGAGAHSLSLSGSTIWIDTGHLPLRNIPVVHPNVDWRRPHPELKQAIVSSVRQQDLNPSHDVYAVFLPQDMPLKYQTIVEVTDELAQYFRQYDQKNFPALVICYHDVGKVLGMELAPQLRPRQVAIIDEVHLQEGDYIDIGESFFGGEIVPLTIKSLAFPS